MKQRQINFFKNHRPLSFGGSLLKSHPKVSRPLSTKAALHLVLKSQRARGAFSMLNSLHKDQIETLVRKQAKKQAVRIYGYVNVGNHLHLIIGLRHPNRRLAQRAYANFVRSVSGLIARLVTGAERNRPSHIQFWEARPFTRIVQWGRDFLRLKKDYFEKNSLQASRSQDWQTFGENRWVADGVG